ncbi:MAG: LytTR family transcriptional regulator [Dinghuibacter sp.]|nr:LytTR family transcriptional regulator [Dinghuibacter sp.]
MLNQVNGKGIILLPVWGGVEEIEVRNIIRIEASSNYSKLHFTNGRTLVVAKVLRWFEAALTAHPFCRIHRTHLVNKDFVQQYIQGEGGKVRLQNGDWLTVSKRRRLRFLESWHNSSKVTA